MKRSLWPAVALLAMAVVAVPTAARAASSNPASVDFGTVHVGSTSTVPVQITVDPLYTVDSLGISKDTRDFASDGGTCQGALGPVTCDASVTFQPLAGGVLSGTLGLQECTSTIDGPVCQALSVPLQGTGESDFSITPTGHDFGSILLGTTHTVDLTVTLDPGLEYFDQGAVEPPFSGDISDCVGKVGPATCTVTESVTLFLKGLQGGAVSMSECRQGPPLECSPEIGAGFSATGVSVFAVSPTTADFGDVETGQTATIDLSITRDADYTGGELNSLTAPFSSVTDGCGTDCDTVTFTPTMTGSWNQTLEVTEIPSPGACSGLHCPEFTIFVKVSGTGIQDPGITAAGVNANLTEGTAFDGTVATFVDPDPSATPAEYSASIDWGDGAATTGTITLTNGVFSVEGLHTYAEEGDDTITTTVTDVDLSSNTATATSTAAVGDAALSATGKTLFSTTGFNGVVAHFIDDDPGSTLSDYSATIDWGDGATSAGTVSAASGGGFDVSGSHTYTGLCTCSITVTIDDTGGASTTATDDTVVFSYLTRGAFVVGNADATQNATVTWWSPKWSSANPLTGGLAPSSFKGFASSLSATPPAAGGTWSTTGGQSATPPTTVPTYMAVLVTSKVRKTSTTLSGPVTEVAVVRVLPGYDPSIGSPGTGVLLGFLP